MILITGATGTIGRALTKELRDAGVGVRAMARDPERARALLGPDVDVVRGDFTAPSSLAPALDGVEALFLLSAPGPSVVDHDAAMLRAVQSSSVRKIVKMSAFGADASPPLRAAGWHQPGEKAVMGSGLAWTLLRPAGFASNALAWAPVVRSGGAVVSPTGAGKHAVVDPRDVAAVAARALTSDAHDGRAYTLTGPEPLSVAEQVAILGEVLGRSLAVEDVTPEIEAERMGAAGVPDAFVAAVLEGRRFVREGKAAARSDDVEAVLGRAPRSFEAWVRDHVALFC